LICWGSTTPNITEVTPKGSIALEMSFPQGVVTYRAFRDESLPDLNLNLTAGDVNNDDYIDLTDIVLISNDAVNFFKAKINTDINSDNITDQDDLLICYNNSKNFVSVENP
jgi:hypothetical protein